ncbi:acyltransferase [Sphingorhabdus sp.]|uniref:acyltransferase family protein n=1 Tax=Sphingorhabdus sp. TaxID=1902408 RepID=UPI0032B76C76
MLISLYALVSIASIGLVCLLARGLVGYGFPIPNESRRIGCLDGLRGYLALLVAISHFILWVRVLALDIAWGAGPMPLVTLGHGPVAIFFMITGLLFYPKVRDGFGAIDWRSLLLSRLFRILPLALLTIAIISVSLWIQSNFTVEPAVLRETAINLLRWITFVGQPDLFGMPNSKLANAGVFWTLFCEWVFYLAVLPLLALARTMAPKAFPRAATPLLMIPLAIPFKLLMPGFAGFMLHFMLGMFVFEVREHKPTATLFRTNGAAVASLVLMVAVIVLLPPPSNFKTVIFYVPFFACVACGHSFWGLFSNQGALVLGEISYGIYVLHGIVLWSTVLLFGSYIAAHPALAVVFLPLLLTIITIISAATFLAIERPMIKQGKKLAGSLRKLQVSRATELL